MAAAVTAGGAAGVTDVAEIYSAVTDGRVAAGGGRGWEGGALAVRIGDNQRTVQITSGHLRLSRDGQNLETTLK